MTAGFYEDDEQFHGFISKELAESMQKMVQNAIGPSMEALRQSTQINAMTSKFFIDAIRPSILNSALESMKMAAQITLPSIPMPALASFDFGTLTQIKLGDEVARQVAESIDYASITERIAQEAEQPVPGEVAEVEKEQFTEEELDDMTADFFARHPDLAEQFNTDPELIKLDPVQKKMMAWMFTLAVTFGIAVLVAWGTVDENLGFITGLGSWAIPAGAVIYHKSQKALNQDNKTDESEDKEKGS